MIPQNHLLAWRNIVPWNTNEQVEQDLVICRALVAIFSAPFLQENLAFRGGTAIHKLYLKPAPRYSEDIDMVQIKPGPIKPILQHLDTAITFFQENRVVKPKAHNNTLLYRFQSEFSPDIRLRLKIEINCREHFNLLGWVSKPFSLQSEWFSGTAEITTYSLEELLGTKLRALYQRKKGRDLFDLYFANQKTKLNIDQIIYCYSEYMKFVVDRPPSKKEFLLNLEEKRKSILFIGDMEGLLAPNVHYDEEKALDWLVTHVVDRL